MMSEQPAPTRPSNTDSSPTKWLYVDLVGPFVVHFSSAKVEVLAPRCANHFANLLTDSDDIPLIGLPAPTPGETGPLQGYRYQLAGNSTAEDSKTKPEFMDTKHLLRMRATIDKGKSPNYNMAFELPTPDVVIPLVPEGIFIYRNSSSAWFLDEKDVINSPRARGLRLVYSHWSDKPVVSATEWPQSTDQSGNISATAQLLRDYNPEALGFAPPCFHFTIRFASNGTTVDDNHQDAYSCFQTMRGMIPGAPNWRVDFDSTSSSGITAKNHSSNPPVDCHAAVLIVQDSD